MFDIKSILLRIVIYFIQYFMHKIVIIELVFYKLDNRACLFTNIIH